MKTLTVHTQRAYNITITNGWQDFSLPTAGKKVCIVTDSNVADIYLQQVSCLLQNKEVFSFVVSAGEQSKCAHCYFEILSFLAQKGFSRKDAILALGGGVVGDLAGFVAATYMRGIDYFQVPTTLLAMIDSSVGGKTALDLPEGKNLVGAFYQPVGVYINLDTLSTLPQREFQNGSGELIKYAFLSKKIAEQSLTVSADLVFDCLTIKKDIVEQDEREGGARMLLNLGHTVGHAVETLSRFTLPHGLCVAKGLDSAIKLSQKYFGFSAETLQQMQALLSKVGLDTSLPFEKQQIISQILLDKKSQDDFVNFVVIQSVGNCQVVKIPHKKLGELL